MSAISNARLKWPNQPAVTSVTEISIDSLPLPAVVVDTHGSILAANQDWIFLHPQALPGRNALDALPAEIRDAVQSGIQQAVGSGPARSAHDFGPDQERRRIAIAAHGAGAILIEQEVSGDRRRKQQSEKMETVGRLVGGVAHDFANLLTLIAGYSDILLNRIGEKDPIRPELDEIRKAANRGARLTGQLLGFTRGQSVQPRPLDLNVIVFRAADLS